MIIAQITGMSSTKYGGVEKFFVASAREAIKEKHRYILVYESPPLSSDFIKDLNAVGGEIAVIPAKRGNTFSFICTLVKFIYVNKIDVIHGHFNPAGDLAIFVGLLMGIKKRFKTIHSMIQNQISGNPIYISKEIPFKTKLITRLSTLFATKVFCVSNAVKNQYNSLIGPSKKRRTQYLGTEINTLAFNKTQSRTKLNLNPNKTYLINIAMHVTGKRIEDCLNVLSNVISKNKNIILLQIGGEPLNKDYEEFLLNYVRDQKLQEHVIWLGLTDNVSEYLNASDILIHLPVAEGLGLVAAEALVQRIPVIASNVGGLPEIVIDQQNGYIVNINDTVEMTTKYVEHLIENPDKSRQYGKNGLYHMKKIFDVNKQAIEYLKEYTDENCSNHTQF